MSKLESLPKSQPAELYIDGTPWCAGEVSGIHDQGLHLSDVAYPGEKQRSETAALKPGSRGDLVFLGLFNDDGDRLVVPVELADVANDSITIDFMDRVSELAGTVRRMLTQSAGDVRKTIDVADAEAALRTRTRRQLQKIIGQFIDEAADHLFDMSSRPSSRDMQDDLYESMNMLKRGRSTILTAFIKRIDEYFEDPIKPQDEKAAANGDVSFEDLDLVDIQDFEDSLLIDRLVKKWQDKFALPLEALTIRFAHIVGTEILDTRLPMHINQLCHAFRYSIQTPLVCISSIN